MDQTSLEAYLQDLKLPAVRYFSTIDSTNNEAWRWIEASAARVALVVADEQTAGRGRLKRRWITSAGSGLAFSLVLRPPVIDASLVNRLVGLAATAVCQTIQALYGFQAQIKWPNDVLLGLRKAAGILVESRWEGDQLIACVVGTGINIAPESIDPRHFLQTGLNFPITCVEAALGHSVDRWELLHAILGSFFSQIPSLATSAFIEEWQSWLAFRGRLVTLSMDNSDQATAATQTGKLIGLSMDGSLELLTTSGDVVSFQAGELGLQLANYPDEMEMNLHV